jgi:polar amino acid transport system permease protein
MYLVLTGTFSALQLIAEAMLDLDRPAPRELLLRFLPWYRTPIAPAAAAPAAAAPAAEAQAPESASGHATRRKLSLADGAVMVEVQDLRKSYGPHLVLGGLDLTVRAGEVIALLGPSGSGKSTLLRCINRLEDWGSGTVRVGGHRLGYAEDGRALAPGGVARQRASLGVGMVFQQFNLFSHLTARENIAGPLRWVHGLSPQAADARAQVLLDRVGLAHRAHALPRHLSGGQQQRVAIARALAPNPQVLLLDEPTSALDPELVNEVLEVIRRLAIEDGLTMIISTHQLRFARDVADRVVFLTGGVVTEEGPADDVLTRPRHPATARFLRVMGADQTTEVAA